jgi:nucleoside-diphosphate-sugar epimerase
VTVRLFTVYGPGEHQGRLLPSLLEAARRGTPIRLTAGWHKRDFTYVEDVAEGLLCLGAGSAPPGAVVNLATGRLTSIRSFVETAAGILGILRKHLEFGVLPTRPEEMEHEDVTVDRLLALTGWVPPTPIDTGIRRTVEWTTPRRVR